MLDTGESTQDELQNGQTSENGDSTASTETARTYTEEELKKFVEDAMSSRGREFAEEHKSRADKAERTVAARDSRIADLEKEVTELESDKFDGNPDALSLRRDNSELQRGKAELQQGWLEVEEIRKENEAHNAEKKAAGVAARYEGGDGSMLISLGLEEQWENLAKTLWKPKRAKGKQGSSGQENLSPDSGMTTGGGVDSSKLSPKEKLTLGLERLKKK